MVTILVVVGVLIIIAIVVFIVMRLRPKSFTTDTFASFASGDLATVEKLLVQCPALLSGRDVDGWTALHFAVQNSQSEVVKLLVSKGADVNAKNMDGEAPLHLTESKLIADFLIYHGANINISDLSGKTPLKVAKEKGRTEVADTLQAHGAKE